MDRYEIALGKEPPKFEPYVPILLSELGKREQNIIGEIVNMDTWMKLRDGAPVDKKLMDRVNKMIDNLTPEDHQSIRRWEQAVQQGMQSNRPSVQLNFSESDLTYNLDDFSERYEAVTDPVTGHVTRVRVPPGFAIPTEQVQPQPSSWTVGPTIQISMEEFGRDYVTRAARTLADQVDRDVLGAMRVQQENYEMAQRAYQQRNELSSHVQHARNAAQRAEALREFRLTHPRDTAETLRQFRINNPQIQEITDGSTRI